MALGLRHDVTIEGVGKLQITTENVATIEYEDFDRVSLQLASNEEADQMVREFKDDSGESMYAAGSIFGKYEALHQFRP